MKLKDFIALAVFLSLIGCGQSHRTGSNPNPTGASGQAVPNPEQDNTPTDSVESDEQNEDIDTENESNETELTDPSDPMDETETEQPTDTDETETEQPTDTDETETTDISDPSDTTEHTDPDTGADPSAPDTTDPFETPSPGTYSYERIPLGNFESAHRAAFHPSGDYALILSQYDTIHVYDWQSQTATPIAIGSNRKMQLFDIVFASDGSCAWIAATNTQNGEEGLVLKFDDATYRALTEDSDLTESITNFTSSMSGKSAKAIAIPWDGSFPIVAYQSGQSGNYIWTLRNFHPETGAFESLYTSTNASAPAEDIAIVNNEFGSWGALVVGGASNAATRYYTELAGQGEWRSNLGNLGNANRVESYPGGDYALVVSWSGRSVYRFKQGEFASYSEAPRFSAMGIWNVSFQDGGRRALITGRASSNGSAGTMLEYRHDLYACDNATAECGQNAIHDVSIWGFDSAPWLAQSNTYIMDTAFRPGCDGGILVGSYNNSSNNGFLGEFQIENGDSCRAN